MNSATWRLRLGTRWQREAPALPRDRVGLELHGIDLLAGASDEQLLPLLTEWLRALAAACAGAPWTSVGFPGAGWQLCMERVDDSGLLLHRAPSTAGAKPAPARLELEELRAALDAGASGLLRDLVRLGRGPADCAGLEKALIQLRGTPVRPPRSSPAVSWPRAAAAGDHFPLRWEGGEDRGGVRSGSPGALELASGHLEVLGPGPPLRLDDVPLLPLAHALADAARVLLDGETGPVELPLPGLQFERGRLVGAGWNVPLDARSLAQDLFSFGHAAAALLVEAHPPTARVASVEQLLARTAEGLARPPAPRPLPPGSPAHAPPGRPGSAGGPQLARRGRALKRLSFERTWQRTVPGAERLAPGPRGGVTAWGDQSVGSFSAGGRPLLEPSGADGLAVSPCGEWAVVRRGEVLEALRLDGAVPGLTAWRRAPSALRPTGTLLASGGRWGLLSRGHGACGLSAYTGHEPWRLPLRGEAWLVGAAGRGWLTTALGSLLQLQLDTGAVGAAVHGPLPYTGPASLHGRRISAVAAGADRGELCVVDAASGTVLLRRPLALGHAGPALPYDRRWYVAGERGGEARLLALSPHGRVAWERPLPFPGPWRLAACAGGILAANRTGAAVCLETTGKVRWMAGSGAPDESEQPLTPWVRRGIAFCVGPQVRALDARTGEPLAEIPLGAPARAALVDRALHLYVLDAAGRLAAWRLGTHLSTVRDG